MSGSWLAAACALLVVCVALGQDVTCDDGSSCPDGTTCCEMADQKYGCCPLSAAVCCSDKIHCCPQNTKCNVSSGACLQKDNVLRFVSKGKAESKKEIKAAVLGTSKDKQTKPITIVSSSAQRKGQPLTKLREKPIVCSDEVSECPSGSTCCRLRSGVFGCCPFEQAACCSDGIHCCPEDFYCNETQRTCNSKRLGISMTWLDRKPTRAHPVVRDMALLCPDNKTVCEQNDTCCNATNGDGCCPLPKAVCCKDNAHCCPGGSVCDLVNKRCIAQNNWEQPLVEHHVKNLLPISKALTRVSVSRVLTSKPRSKLVCPGGQVECPDDNSCCPLPSGEPGCCPLPNAVCCSDKIHCCPNGTKCNLTTSACDQDLQLTKHTEKQPATKMLSVKSVICSGGQSECPDGNTCCPMGDQYGCCPLLNAVCCSDGQHCCPQGYVCNVSAGECTQGEKSVAWLTKLPGLKKEMPGSVVCPGGTAECPDGQTCCLLSSGQWGCCPLPNAVCCSDGVHCCPQCYTCDVSSGTCTNGLLSIAWSKKQTAVNREMPGNVVCPDGTAQCPDGQTCCLLSTGDYGCCPYPNAVCCSDGVHCCPQFYTCDVSSGTCTNGLLSIAWSKKEPAVNRVMPGSVVCPGGTAECLDGQTCCLLSSGQWGCCPLPNAVCCSDGEHCCPQCYTCNVSSQTCTKGLLSVAWSKKQTAVNRKMPGNVVCPDGTAQCPDGQTCCLLSTGEYGCCPYPNAVCCSDGVHCCPQFYTCDVSTGTCTNGLLSIAWSKKQTAVNREMPGNVVCPDGKAQCPDGQTCCLLSTGEYGCCPYPKAVCCSDGVHCCPQFYTCDVSSGTCTNGLLSIAWSKKEPAVNREMPGNVVCPDGTAQCPDGQTCCLLSTGEYGCCPYPKAVCCSDGVHCCPQFYRCDVSSGTCTNGLLSIAWSKKEPAVNREMPGNVVCPDGTAQCPDGQTCCLLSTGEYGCCPYPKAVCCSDGVHCCPQFYRCDVSSGTCTNGLLSIAWSKKEPAVNREMPGNVVCPDGTAQCPDGQTCCLLSTGEYGCCPYPKAVCCSDGVHCCPQFYRCDVSSGTCTNGLLSIAWSKKEPAVNRKMPGNVVCPGGMQQCPDGQTCCLLSSEQYGCCPLSNAVCCSDGVHCCPQFSTCDDSSGTCTNGLLSIAWSKKQPAVNKQLVGNVICPDGQSQCSDGQTCCQQSDSSWGCCPLPNAVCCSDGVHCCPEDTTCNLSTGQCDRPQISVPWQQKQAALTRLSTENVICPDKASECNDGQTCCKKSSGQYGCCAVPNAVCCQDGLHCCPHNYTCNETSLQCQLKFKDFNIVCPDQASQCGSDETCCLLSSGLYGCCPRPNAVCCADHLHCCPEGYTCDSSMSQCTQGDLVQPWLAKKQPLPVV